MNASKSLEGLYCEDSSLARLDENEGCGSNGDANIVAHAWPLASLVKRWRRKSSFTAVQNDNDVDNDENAFKNNNVSLLFVLVDKPVQHTLLLIIFKSASIIDRMIS